MKMMQNNVELAANEREVSRRPYVAPGLYSSATFERLALSCTGSDEMPERNPADCTNAPSKTGVAGCDLCNAS